MVQENQSSLGDEGKVLNPEDGGLLVGPADVVFNVYSLWEGGYLFWEKARRE